MAEIQTYSIDEPYLPIECRLGEGPLYGEGTDQLRFLDIIKKQIHFLDVKEGPSSHRVVQLDDSVGYEIAAPEISDVWIYRDMNKKGNTDKDIEGNDEEFIVAAKRGYALFNKKTGKLRYVKKIYEDNPKMADR
ncbi:rRNA-processing protein cgr1 [Rhizina undulata]